MNLYCVTLMLYTGKTTVRYVSAYTAAAARINAASSIYKALPIDSRFCGALS